jgi:phage shock protein A
MAGGPKPPPPEPGAGSSSASGASEAEPGYDNSGVPTFDSVREKIETRYETSIGAAELDSDSTEGRSIEEQYEARQKAAAERLAAIRESMHKDAR